ncbi:MULTISPECIES: type II secretion system protein [unclassified Frigoribacterium]|uniref:PulJ/GspJ family protein n=1 Tax=unclassified Frigoribacterium TaxID=2627005 RepID=UPI0015658EBA|nr:MULTISPECIES: type II secretion system protein [unclassified Frigoribacterium]NQW87892.1 type II secretion system protein [Frigoribacterium sp. VKM Ac-2860]NQX09299.1 type II secretion system protein [Frigoribacterium sp. VKM Ac-2859]
MTALRRLIARARRDDGISLAELLVAIMVFGIVLTVVSTTFVSLTKATAQARFIDANTRVASNGLNDLSRTIRAARTIAQPGGTEASAFTLATTESLTLTTAVNTADSLTTVPRRVTYRLEADRTLSSSTVVATPLQTDFWQFTSPATKRALGGTVVTAASSGSPLFTYLDFTGKTLTPDASGALTASQLPSIAAVTISLTIDRTSSMSSQAVTLQNTVSLSNLAGGATT